MRLVDGRMAALELAPVSLDGVERGCVTVEGVDYEYTYIIVGVPHTVIFEEKRSRAFADYAPLGARYADARLVPRAART